MKLISWNVNGIRAVTKKGFNDFFHNTDFDVLCLQETKVHNDDLPAEINQLGALDGYSSFWNGADKKGYSGTAIFTKIKPISYTTGIGHEPFDSEGRIQTMEFEQFFLVNVYVPNSKRALERLEEKVNFNKLFINYCEKLRKQKPVIFTGDLNVAHKEIDLRNPKPNEKNAGFTIEEREAFQKQLDKGYIDTFREFNKEPDNYTWWSYMHQARSKNIGWRIDYFVISKELKPILKNAEILPEVMGSDHCPVTLELKD